MLRSMARILALFTLLLSSCSTSVHSAESFSIGMLEGSLSQVESREINLGNSMSGVMSKYFGMISIAHL